MSAVGKNPYQMARGSGVCAATGRELKPGDRVVTALIDVPDDEVFGRLDYLAEAWDAGARPEPPESLFGYWKGVVPEPDAKPQPLLDADSLIDLFEQLEDATEPGRLAFRYLIALILIRKRQLVCERTDRDADGRTVMHVRARGVAKPPELGGEGPPLVPVVDPKMDEAVLAEATLQLGEIMQLDSEREGESS